MSQLIKDLQDRKLIHLPSWLHASNVHMLTIAGSVSYGVADTSVKDKLPDFDVVGFAMPPRERLFPSQHGAIIGFGKWKDPAKIIEEDDPWQKHHVYDASGNGGKGKEWDFCIYGIVRYFELLRMNNPNMVDSLFTPEECVIHITQLGRFVRDNRKKFLGKIAWKTFRGYASGQIKKANLKINQEEMQAILNFEGEHDIPHKTTYNDLKHELSLRENGESGELRSLDKAALEEYEELFVSGLKKNTRFEDNKKYQMDRKFLYNIIRLYDECDQILEGNGEVDIDLRRSKEVMKAVRRGEWTTEQIYAFMQEKDKSMEVAYNRCTLPEYPNEQALLDILVKCIEMHYGDLSGFYEKEDWAVGALKNIDEVIAGIRKKIYGG